MQIQVCLLGNRFRQQRQIGFDQHVLQLEDKRDKNNAQIISKYAFVFHYKDLRQCAYFLVFQYSQEVAVSKSAPFTLKVPFFSAITQLPCAVLMHSLEGSRSSMKKPCRISESTVIVPSSQTFQYLPFDPVIKTKTSQYNTNNMYVTN